MVSYLQYLSLRHELFAGETQLQSYMNGQVCNLEKLLQMYISPQAVINPKAFEVTLWLEAEPAGSDLFISDTAGQIFFTEAEFGLNEFTVVLPASASPLINYVRELLNAYKLPGKQYTIVLQ